jgi:RNA polymerase sigma-70 factor (ECF subfamily)
MGDVIRLPQAPTDKERQLQERFHAGEADAFDELVRPHLDQLYTFCLRVTGRPEDAFDLAHDALVRARRKHRLYTPGRPVRPWLVTIARNLWRSRMRSPWVRLRDTLRAWTEPSFADDGPDTASEKLDVDAKVRSVLAEMPVAQREALALFHLEDMSYAEMSEITGTSVAALKQRVRRGGALLAERITERYPELRPGRTG